MDADNFSRMVDRTGLKLSDQQKAVLFDAWPLFTAMVARATPPMPREAEPSLVFTPEVR